MGRQRLRCLMKFPWAMDPRSVEALLPKSPDRCDSSSIMLVCYQLWLGPGKTFGTPRRQRGVPRGRYGPQIYEPCQPGDRGLSRSPAARRKTAHSPRSCFANNSELEPPFTPRAGRVPNVPDPQLVKKFGPHRLSDGDSPSKEGGNSDEVSLSFKGEQFQGFSVFASPAPPVRRKSSKDLK